MDDREPPEPWTWVETLATVVCLLPVALLVVIALWPIRP